jgi:predicted ATPase with chaperone activity
MDPIQERSPASSPLAPATLEDAGLGAELVGGLLLKALHNVGEATGHELSKRLGLVFGAFEVVLQSLKSQLLCEIVGGALMGGASYRYRLTEAGRVRAVAAFERNHYSGVAPVTLQQYRRYMESFMRSAPRRATNQQVREAFSHLVIDQGVLDQIGPAINSGHSMFIYGPPGNGKTAMARSVRSLLTGLIAIPHALEVDGQIIRLFDPDVHEPVPVPDRGDYQTERRDSRWVMCRRPMVSVGGELTLERLGLAYNERSGVYRAPIQTMANGGVLLIDDFGRQRCAPRDLLNWWMVPLESRVEYLMLQSGEKVEMPFVALVIFSTNLKPADLVDEAFLRRIQYKIYAENPTVEDFIRIFERCCQDLGIPFERELVEALIGSIYRPRRIELRACHPRDLIKQALSLASYQGQPRRLTFELLHTVCTGYFMNASQADTPSVWPSMAG